MRINNSLPKKRFTFLENKIKKKWIENIYRMNKEMLTVISGKFRIIWKNFNY